jgi:malic enzyme
MTPIIYTPTVGEAVQKGSHIFRHSRGLYVSPGNVEILDRMAESLPSSDIDVIVVTDNQGILGIGDQGVGGMGIPIGKLSLYTLGAGISPAACLPICLDVGTDNELLLDDPLYLGHKHKRIKGDSYYRFIDRFVEKIKSTFPNALLQWEDFSKQNAFSNLEKFKDDMLSFNDDIQGTGAVVLAGILGALKVTGEALENQRFLVFGAGAGGVGVGRQIKNALLVAGLSEDEATNLIFTVDSRGLVMSGRPGLDDYKKDLSKNDDKVKEWKVKDRSNITLEEVITNAKITVLLGTSGQPGTFTQSVVEAMGRNADIPLIFPLSNPTSKTEALPKDIYEWTEGKAIVVTGSPFDDVVSGDQTFRIGQGNNVFIFPGVGLGALAAQATLITSEMFTAAATSLAEMTPPDAKETHGVYPRIAQLSEVSEKVALAVFDKAVELGLSKAPTDVDPAKIIRKRIWKPEYLPYRKG